MPPRYEHAGRHQKAYLEFWQVRCESASPGQQNQCAVVQTVTAEDRPDVGLTIVVVKTAEHKSPLLRVVAPIGVLLPSGLGSMKLI
jgi:invasion protein IalB